MTDAMKIFEKIPGIVTVAQEIATSADGAKAFTKSWSFRGATAMAVTWTIHNVALWWGLEQSTEAFMIWGFMGFLGYLTVIVGTLRRNDIEVPRWIVVIAELLVAEEEA